MLVERQLGLPPHLDEATERLKQLRAESLRGKRAEYIDP